MICPKCGNEIAEGHLYCEVCGEEIQIVPDFDLQVEESINVTLTSVAGEVKSDADIGGITKEIPTEKVVELIRTGEADNETGESVRSEKNLETGRRKIGILWPFIAGGALIAVLIFVIVFFVRNAEKDPVDTYEEAMKLYEAGNYTEAIDLLKTTDLSALGNSDNVLLLADCYFSLSKYDECIAVLKAELENRREDTGLLKRLMECYIALNDTESIKRLLSETSNKEILSAYDDYISKPPLFSLESGTYTDDEQLSLISEDEGEIHYTLDGSEPTKESTLYVQPFVFDVGEHTVKAVFVNQKGIVSEPVEHTYVIERKMLDDPVLLTEGGKYTDPELIRLEKPVGAVIYYTDDGSDPGSDANVYNQPIPMPIREKTYRFIMIDGEGVTSQIIEATYTLQMATLVDVTMAENAVQLCLTIGGKGVKQSEYKCSSALRINNKNYYLVEEYSLQTAEKVKTGRVYAVDVLTGELYKLDMTSVQGDYQLTPFQ
ncbi:MAG: chitobiase/beta-hexosaminidase C-terminal domain-containing protein [Lachnospiraceae bacterium]|nr:chitobiase/beta-hexosaminidase C-terminal domain-containing protein [Lachnospiraceae bacterium]